MSDDEYCPHSMTKSDCLPCWKSMYHRQCSHIERLRQMLVDAGAGSALAEHDAYWFGGNARPLPDPSDSANGDTQIWPCPYRPKPTHGDDCPLCQGLGTIEVKAVPSSMRLLPGTQLS